MKQRIYLDHAAGTPMDPNVLEAMMPYMRDQFGNAGGLYQEGRKAKDALDNARKTVSGILNTSPDEIIFTGGGTEGDVLALVGVSRAYMGQGRHIVSSTIEHHAVLHALETLEKEGFEITHVDVEPNGIVDPQKLERAIRPDTILVSVMYANNEIGTIQPIEEIAQIVRKIRKGKNDPLAGPFFHTDACQAAGYLDLDVKKLGVDLLVMNGSKIYGPKGVGALFIRKGVRIKPIIMGGAQEGKRRAGTENIAGIVGFASALSIAHRDKDKESKRLSILRDDLISRIQRTIPKVVLNGDPVRRLPNNVNVSILDIEGEATVLYLDEKGISCSTGSACTSESLDPSHVILALGKPYEYAHASMRFTLGRGNTKKDIDHLIYVLPGVVEILRKISPVSIDMNATRMSHPEAFAGEGLRVKAHSRNYK